MSIIATYLGAVAVVAAAKMNAAIATYNGSVMCQYRSPVRSACQAFASAVMTARMYGGAVKRRVSIVPNPLF